MQARASEIEAQLTETQDKLQKLQEQKAQLEARNALLEKVSNLCMKPLNTPLADQVSPNTLFSFAPIMTFLLRRKSVQAYHFLHEQHMLDGTIKLCSRCVPPADVERVCCTGWACYASA